MKWKCSKLEMNVRAWSRKSSWPSILITFNYWSHQIMRFLPDTVTKVFSSQSCEMNGNEVVGNEDREEIWRLLLTCTAEESTHIGICYTMACFLGRGCTSVTFFLNLEQGGNVGDSTSWKEHKLIELKNRGHLKICHRIVTSRQNCVWRKEIEVWEHSSSSEDLAKSIITGKWGLSCPIQGMRGLVTAENSSSSTR